MNVKFVKIEKKDTPTYPSVYEAGAIYFDENKKQIMLGQGTAIPTTYGGAVADASIMSEDGHSYLIIKDANDGDLVKLDLSQFADATAMASAIATKIENITAADAIVATASTAAGVKSTKIELKLNENQGDVSLSQDGTGLKAAVSLKESITVAGGPLADDIQDNWPTDAEWTVGGVKTIPAGLTLTEILTKLFTKEINGTVSFTYSNWNPTLNAPTVSLSSTSTQEVGSSVTASWTANSSVSNNSSTATCTASQGYFTSTSGSWNSGNYTQTKAGSQSGTATVTATWNGTTVKTSGTSVVCQEGTNTLACSNSGVTATLGNFNAATIYASTNTKKCLSNVNAVLDVDAKAGTKPLTSSASKTVSAQYYAYVGYSTKTTASEFDSDSIKALQAAKTWITVNGTTNLLPNATTSDGTSIVIAVPAKYKLSGVKNSLGMPILDNFSSTATVAYTNGSTTTDYTVYVYPIISGVQVDYKEIVITKA